MAATRPRNLRPPPTSAPTSSPLAWSAVADALGYSILVFVFLPILAALPEFVSYELRNPYNYGDAVVLALLPARAVRAFVNAFAAGVIPGSISGVTFAALLCAWSFARPAPRTLAQRLAFGALVGLIAGLLAVLAVVAIQFGREGVTNAPWFAIAFEAGSAAVCGLVAAPTALGLLGAERASPAARTSIAR